MGLREQSVNLSDLLSKYNHHYLTTVKEMERIVNEHLNLAAGEFVLTELMESQRVTSGSRPSVTRVYDLFGRSSDTKAAIAFARQNVPASWELNSVTVNGATIALLLPRTSLEMEPIFVDEADTVGRWRVTAQFENTSRARRLDAAVPPEPSEGDGVVESFSTGGGSEKITQAISTRSKNVASGTAKDYKGAIGVTENGPEGCTIVVPAFSFSIAKRFSDDDMSVEFRKKLASLTGRINSSTFRGWDAGEVLFTGASATERQSSTNQKLWDITFNFQARANETDLTIAGIPVAEKQGWDYAWIAYEKKTDTSAKATVQQPVQCNIETVYRAGNFDDLNCA